MILVEREVQRLVVEQDGCFWLAVLACHWTEVCKALMAVVVSPWCRVLGPAKAAFESNLNLVKLFLFLLVI